MEEYKYYIDIFNELINSMLSLAKINEKYANKQNYFEFLKSNDNDNLSDKDIVEMIIHLKIRLSREAQSNNDNEKIDEVTENIKNKILESKKGKFFYENIHSNNGKISSNHHYIRLLIHYCNKENSMISKEIEANRKNQVKNIISIFETLMSNLLAQIYRNEYNHEKLNDEKISYKDIAHLTSVNDIHEFVIEQKVISLLYENISKWLAEFVNNFTKTTNKKIKREYSEFIDIVNEIYERRNIITHNNGVINHLYMKRVNENMIEDSFCIGKEIEITENYIQESINNTLNLGIILFLHACEKLGYHKKLPFINNITSIGLELLNSGYYNCGLTLFNEIDRILKDNSELLDINKYNIFISKLLLNNQSVKNEIKAFFDNKQDLSKQDIMAKAIFLNENDYLCKIDNFIKGFTYYKIVNIFEWPIFKLLENDVEYIEYKKNYLYTEDV